MPGSQSWNTPCLCKITSAHSGPHTIILWTYGLTQTQTYTGPGSWNLWSQIHLWRIALAEQKQRQWAERSIAVVQQECGCLLCYWNIPYAARASDTSPHGSLPHLQARKLAKGKGQTAVFLVSLFVRSRTDIIKLSHPQASLVAAIKFFSSPLSANEEEKKAL